MKWIKTKWVVQTTWNNIRINDGSAGNRELIKWRKETSRNIILLNAFYYVQHKYSKLIERIFE